jgi:SAM-dependent methyltransferase
MAIAQRTATIMRGLIKRYGPTSLKRALWDEEFSVGKWNFIDHTAGDCVYPYLEKYVADGSILDLGCGPGNTANELADTAYRTYVGVDISEAALVKARKRSEACGRSAKNSFAQGDFLSYLPSQRFDVILFRESMYHVPLGKVKLILDRYTEYLNDHGVFIVRMFASGREDGKSRSRPNAMIDIIEKSFDVVENRRHQEPGEPTVLVFRPRGSRIPVSG